KVFQGRNSISWAKSILPVFIKASRDHPGSLRQLQIVDTALCPETRITPGVQSRPLSVNRTAVTAAWYCKQQPTFADTLAAVRREIWRAQGLSSSRKIPDTQKLPQRLRYGITHALCYAA